MRRFTTIVLGVVLGASSLLANGGDLAKKCVSCHGANFEKKALNKSQVIKGWEASKVEVALKGYKAGTYGGSMKGLMKGQVITLNDTQIKELAKYIASKK